MMRRDLEEAGADWIVQDCSALVLSNHDNDGNLQLTLRL
jgi:hypothetical protein